MNPNFLELVEQPMEYKRLGQTLFTGTPDRVVIWPGKVAAVLDRKFGYKEVPGPVMNLQVWAYLCMVAQEYVCDVYYGAIFQPRLAKRPYMVHFTPADITVARYEIEAIYDLVHRPDRPRTASPEACAFCLGASSGACPEHRDWCLALEKLKNAPVPVEQWSDEQMDLFLARRSQLSTFLEDVYARIKKVKAAKPERLPGWKLKDGAERRIVEDIPGAYQKLTAAPVNVSAKEFSDACTFSVPEMIRVFWQGRRETADEVSQKAAEGIIESYLGDLIVKKQNAPSLVRVEKGPK